MMYMWMPGGFLYMCHLWNRVFVPLFLDVLRCFLKECVDVSINQGIDVGPNATVCALRCVVCSEVVTKADRVQKCTKEDVWTRLSRSMSPKPSDSSQVICAFVPVLNSDTSDVDFFFFSL